jgi:hypothetical protein
MADKKPSLIYITEAYGRGSRQDFEAFALAVHDLYAVNHIPNVRNILQHGMNIDQQAIARSDAAVITYPTDDSEPALDLAELLKTYSYSQPIFLKNCFCEKINNERAESIGISGFIKGSQSHDRDLMLEPLYKIFYPELIKKRKKLFVY